MKTSLIRKVIPALALATLSITAAHAECCDTKPIKRLALTEGGDKAGGGGEPMEIDIDMIRGDLVAWINAGGARDLKLPGEISYGEYTQAMLQILTPHAVVLTFVDKDSSTDPELSVKVSGQEKTCRGFISRNDARPHILCHRGRYKNASEGERYQLIHHEYAGLAQVELNIGASSDYSISKQISDYLVPVTVLRLAVRGIVKSKEVPTSCLVHLTTVNYYNTDFYNRRSSDEFANYLETKGYKLTKRPKKAAISMTAQFSRYSHSTDHYLNLSVWHPSTGFKRNYMSMGHAVIPDPRREEIKSQMERTKSVAEYQRLQTQLQTGVFNDAPAVSAESKLELPTCAEFYGKQTLTLTNGQQSE